MPDIAVRIRSDRSEDFFYSESIAHQCKRKFKGIRVDCLTNAEDCFRIGSPEPIHGGFGLLSVNLIIKLNAQGSRESVILHSDPVDLIESCKLNGRDSQSLLQISRRGPCLRIQDQVEIGLCHLFEL